VPEEETGRAGGLAQRPPYELAEWGADDVDAAAERSALPAESVALALRLDDPRLVQRVLLMLVDETPPVPPELLAPLASHPSFEVRLTAVSVLSRWSDEASRAVLYRFLADPSLAVRDRVLCEIERTGARWTPATATAAITGESDAGLARRMAELVARDEPAIGARVLQRIAAVLLSSRRSAPALGEVLQVLRRLDESTWRRLVSHIPPHLVPHATGADDAQSGGVRDQVPEVTNLS